MTLSQNLGASKRNVLCAVAGLGIEARDRADSSRVLESAGGKAAVDVQYLGTGFNITVIDGTE